MWLIPFEKLTIRTAMRSEDAILRLSWVVEAVQIFRWNWSKHKPYQGSIEGLHFSISRIMNYRATVFPIVIGEIQPEPGGCSINLTLSPHALTIIFILLCGSAFGFMFYSIISEFISSFL